MSASNTVEITAKDLPLFCPSKSGALWNSHPKVGLRLDEHGEARCPYCGTHYKFVGELPTGHH